MARNIWNTKARSFRVGMLVLVAGTLFTCLLLFLLGSRARRDLVSYAIAFEESVKGMVVGSKVNFQGVPIGAVADLRFVRGKTIVSIEVDPGKALVQSVTRARIDRLLVTGQVTIELEGYSEGAPRLAAGGTIEPKESPMDKLTRSLPDLLVQAAAVLDKVEKAAERASNMLSDENCASLAVTLQNLERASTRLPQRIEQLLDETRPLAREASRTLASAQGAATALTDLTKREDLVAALAALRRSAERLESTEAALSLVLEEAQGLLRGARPGVHDALANARDALGELGRLARQLRLAPSSLLYGTKLKDEAAAPPGDGK